MAKRQSAIKLLELSYKIRNDLLVRRSIEKTDVYDFYIAVAEYRVNFINYGQKKLSYINKTLTINNLFEFKILLSLFRIKK